MRRLDRAAALITAAGLVLCAVGFFAIRGGEELFAEVSVDGEAVLRLPLSCEPRELAVEAGGGVNVVMIGGGRAAVVSADCPDRLCVRNGEISRAGEGSVCLPHKLVLRITGAGGGDVDAVSR